MTQEQIKKVQEFTLDLYMGTESPIVKKWAAQMNELSIVDPEQAVQMIRLHITFWKMHLACQFALHYHQAMKKTFHRKRINVIISKALDKALETEN
jgi:hypothetical protein